MNVTWVVDYKMLVGKVSESLPDVIRSLGYNVELVEREGSIDWEDYWRDEGAGPTVVYGCHQVVTSFINHIPAIPGTYPSNRTEVESLKPSTYMDKIPYEYRLNDFYILATVSQLLCDMTVKDYENSIFGYVFIKDNRAFKRFTGEVIKTSDLKQKMQFLVDVHKLEMTDIILLASRKNILSEHRFVIVNQKIISSSTYNVDGVVDVRIDEPKEARELVEKLILTDFVDSKCYTIDIAMTDTWWPDALPKVIEINSFSCSGLYACDLEKVVTAVSEQAKEDYYTYMKDVYND